MSPCPLRKPTTPRGEYWQKIGRIYDPLGVASSLTLSRKLLHHDYCNLKIGWDEQLPSDLATKWAKWESKSPERITFTRTLVQYQEPINSISLHVFGDASDVGVVAAKP